jgi:hypothetical protein
MVSKQHRGESSRGGIRTMVVFEVTPTHSREKISDGKKVGGVRISVRPMKLLGTQPENVKENGKLLKRVPPVDWISIELERKDP